MSAFDYSGPSTIGASDHYKPRGKRGQSRSQLAANLPSLVGLVTPVNHRRSISFGKAEDAIKTAKILGKPLKEVR